MAIQPQIRKRGLFLGAALLLFVLVLFFTADILRSYARLFSIDNATKGADCIVILSGNELTRPDQAAKLVQEGYSQTLYHTEQKEWNSRHKEILGSHFDKAQAILATYNLSADIIPSTKGGATSTFDEAYDLVVFLRTHPMKHIILVTDTFHTARAYYAFKKILDLHGQSGLHIEMSAAPNDIFDESNWYKSEKGMSAYIIEPVKYLFYLLNSSNSTTIQED